MNPERGAGAPENESREPLALVGLGCRFQGVEDVEALWRLLADGRVAMREVPADRFPLADYYDPTPGRRGRIVTREGGYLDDVWSFDNQLFRLSHREAGSMDPQHRLLLEVGYSALEDAGLPLSAVSGKRGSVYVGMFTGDYRDRVVRRADVDLDVYLEIGTTRSSAAGRLSHAFNLVGPAATVDAACASSLLAVHLAAQSLWTGEAEIALAGGSNLVLEPQSTVCFSQSGMLSPESRCKFGDASANGFVRSEGVVVAVLKTLSAARRDGDRIYALIHATGAANDGRAGDGLFMTPSTEGQAALLRHIYDGLDVNLLRYVEAHGTGTRAGDPVETKALAHAVSRRRTNPDPLWLGSIKTNLGHTEGAAGLAGLLRAALVLHHRTVPPSLHFHTPNPDIPWAEGNFRIPTECVALPAEGPILAGVSSFGLSGTNAHVVLGTAPPPVPAGRSDAPPPDAWLLPVSGHTPEALRAAAAQLVAHVAATPSEALPDLLHTAASRRTHHAFRALAIGAAPDGAPPADRDALAAALAAIAADPAPAAAAPHARRIAFVFPGQGGQWAGMGRGMRERDPAFRAALDEVDAAFRRVVGWSALEALDDPSSAWTTDITRLQPVLVAVQIALAKSWIAHGVQPDVVVGHSMGEVAAAAIAGALDLDDAVRVICTRSRLLGRIAGQGAMGVVGLGVAEVTAELADANQDRARVAVAVSNADASTVISGDPDAVDAILARLGARGVFVRRVDVDVASHSPQTEPLLAELRAELATICPRATSIRIVSTVEAAPVDSASLDADYWARNMRCAVRFADATRVLLAEGVDTFVECNPHPVLVNPVLQTLKDAGSSAIAVSSMRRDAQDRLAWLGALGALWSHGVEPAWETLVPPGAHVRLPGHPFQRERFALPDEDPRERTVARGKARGAWLPDSLHLGADPSARVWEVPLSTRASPWLLDHKVRGSALLPGAGFVELALAAGAALPGEGPVVAEDIELIDYLAVPERSPTALQVHLRAPPVGPAQVRFHTFDEGDALRLHATVRLRRELSEGPPADEPPLALYAERLDAELGRARRNADYACGVLVTRVARPGALAQRARRTLRATDGVYADDADGRLIVVVGDLRGAESLATIAGRLRVALGGAPGDRDELLIRGATLDPSAPDARAFYAASLADALPVIDSPSETTATLAGADFYAQMSARGIDYGPAFRFVEQLRRVSGSTITTLRVPPEVLEDLAARPAHAALLDGCFQAAVAGFLGEDVLTGTDAPRDGFLPVGVRRLTLFQAPSEHLRCHAWVRGGRVARKDEIVVDFFVLDPAGDLVLAVDGLRVRQFSHRADEPREARIARWFHRWTWESAALAAPAEPARAWIVLGDDALAEALGTHPLGGLDDDALRAARAGLPAETPVDIVWVADTPAPPTRSNPALTLERASAACLELLGHVRRLTHSPAGRVRLWVVTQDAWPQSVERPSNPNAATLWGLGRVLLNEAPELSLRLVDVDDVAPDRLVPLLRACPDEQELSVYGGVVRVHRLRAEAPRAGGAPGADRAPGPDEAVVLALQGARGPRAVHVDARPRVEAGQVLVRVAAATAAWPGPEGSPPAFVGAAGVVVEVAPGVSTFAPGDRVVTLVPTGSPTRIPRFLLARPAHLARVPDAVPPPTASSIAAHWLPASLAVDTLAELGPDDRVLLLGADAPTVQAAALLAAERTPHVVVAARTLAARAALRGNGIDATADARSPDLGALVLDLAGQPFDVVVDLASTGPTPLAALVLGPSGRWIHGVGARPDEAGETTSRRRSHALDAHARLQEQPRLVRELLQTLLDRAARNVVSLPPLHGVRPWGADADPQASVTVDLDSPSVRVQGGAGGPVELRRDGVYVVSGGTGGLGLRVAGWLAAHGAGHIVLASRSGRVRPEDLSAFGALSTSGADVRLEVLDIADATALSAAIARWATELGPLRGVFHLAGILDDATQENLTPAHFTSVMHGKVLGAWNLHLTTARWPLDHFVMFSSAATTLGSPGQGNYAAANAFLDSLAHHRRSIGLPAVSLGWGVWSETGLAAARDERGARLERRGLAGMAPTDALEAMGRALGDGDIVEVTIADVDWTEWARTCPDFTRTAAVRDLVPARTAPTPQVGLAGASPSERPAVALALVRGLVGEVTRLPAARVPDTQPLAALGLDSLMAVELRVKLSEAFGVELSPRRILGMADLRALASAVLEAVGGPAVPAPDPSLVAPVLDAEIRPSGAPGEAAKDDAVFLTGATGFVGAHLLRALLDRRSGDVACLVRAPNAGAGAERLRDQLRVHGLDRAGDVARIRVVLGDLAAPRFGLSDAAFGELAASIVAVYHCGAFVNHALPYEALAPSNVGGTAEALRLACTGPAKPVHHVSTIAVFPFTTRLAEAVVLEETTPLTDRSEPFFGAYAETKWAAEQLCLQARSRGVDVSVYRLGLVTGSHHAATNPAGDAVWRLVDAVARLGRAPAFTAGLGLTPVDYVAEALVALAEASEGGTFHLCGRTETSTPALVRALGGQGLPAKLVDRASFAAALQREADRTWPVYPLLPKLAELSLDALEHAALRLSDAATRSALPDDVLALSTVEDALLERYLRQLVEDGALPRASKARSGRAA